MRTPPSPLPPDLADAVLDLQDRRSDLALDVRWHASVPSTMDLAMAEAEKGAAGGLVIGADAQTAGRGRRGHAWSSPVEGGLYYSFLCRPTRDVSLVTLAAGDAVRRGILQATGLGADLKWPNDLLVGRRKLAGILAEGLGIGGASPAVIVGVGLNVRAAPLPPDVDARATSLESELGRSVDRGPVLAATLEALADRLAALERGGADDILRGWRDAAPSASGARVEWDGPGGRSSGVTAGVDDSGALLVRTAHGVERIVGGDVRWR